MTADIRICRLCHLYRHGVCWLGKCDASENDVSGDDDCDSDCEHCQWYTGSVCPYDLEQTLLTESLKDK